MKLTDFFSTMEGWKTWVGGIGLILSGIGMMVASVNWETFVIDQSINDGIALVAAGFAAIGIGHKVQKAGALDKPATPAAMAKAIAKEQSKS